MSTDPSLHFLLVCLAGAVGTGARYALSLVAVRLAGAGFPHGTLAVNLLGSLLMGVIVQAGGLLSPTWKAVLATGLMGGFTTYSAFNQATIELVRAGALGAAALNVSLTLVGCLAAGAIGMLGAGALGAK